MSQITNGKVSFGRTVKTGDYENKRVDVEIAFSVGEGEDHTSILEQAGALAVGKAHELLGLKTAGSVPAQQPPVTSAPERPASPPAAASPPKRAAAPKKPPVVDVGPISKEEIAEATAARAAPPVEDDHAQAAVEGAADPTAFTEDDLVGTAPEITEAQLVDACAKKQSATGNGIAIKQLIYKYVAPPKSVREIEPARRQDFLNELAKL